VCPALLQLPDPSPYPVETALGLRLPFARKVARFSERKMHAFVEVVPRLAVVADDIVGDQFAEQRA
jgi:hypothetical protein